MKRGLMISFIGSDGSGKTTIINELPSYLKQKGVDCEVVYYHWRPGFVIKKDVSTEGERVSNPHEKAPYGIIKSFVKFMLINIDYISGYFFKVKKETKEGKLVIFDRYYYDYYLDKVRYRLSLSNKIIKGFQFMIPKPDMTFLLVGTPEVLYERKKEVSVEEIASQVETMKRYKNIMSPSMLIDVDNPIDMVVDIIGSFILSKQ